MIEPILIVFDDTNNLAVCLCRIEKDSVVCLCACVSPQEKDLVVCLCRIEK